VNLQEYEKLQARRSHPKDYDQVWDRIDQDLEFGLQHAGVRPGDRVLDLGTRDGYLVQRLSEQGFDAIGIELIEKVARYARRQGRDVVQMDMHNLEFSDASFDLVISRHSLEHSLNYRQVLAECARVLKDNGFLFIVIPIEYGKPHGLHTQPFHTEEQLPNMLKDMGFHVLVQEEIPPRGNPVIDAEQRIIVQKPAGVPLPHVPPTVFPVPHLSWRQRWACRIKDLIKQLHGDIYHLALPALVRPPAARYRGQVRTIARIGILSFLESWQDRIHGKVLDVGVGTWAYPRQLFQDRCDYTATDCFEHPNIDVVSDIHHLTDVFPPESFDFVLCTDVFEHIPRPWEAIQELHAVLKPGGILLLTTPFNFHLHSNEQVRDYWRISADGLRLLLQEIAGFDEVEITYVGHPEFPFSHTVVARKGE